MSSRRVLCKRQETRAVAHRGGIGGMGGWELGGTASGAVPPVPDKQGATMVGDPLISGWIAVGLSLAGMALAVVLVRAIARSVPPKDPEDEEQP